jgi:hypothetical protein
MTFLRRHILGLIALAVLVLAAGALLVRYQNMRGQAWSLTSPLGVGDVAFQMSELEQKDQFEDEIQLGLRSRTGGSSDYFIYQMVRAYATREYKDPKQSAKWAEFAAEYAEKALSADPNDLSNIFNAGQIICPPVTPAVISKGRGCRPRPHSCRRRLQRFPHAVERRRPRPPHSETSQGGVREAAVVDTAGKSPLNTVVVVRAHQKQSRRALCRAQFYRE